jgi:hypothetical protein
LRIPTPGFGELHCWAQPDRPRQPGAALKEGAVHQVLAVDLEEVEDAVDDRIRGHVLWRGIRDAEALLEPAERRLIAVVRDHLAVEYKVSDPPGRQRRTDLGVGAGEVLPGARFEPHVGAVFGGRAALAVKLALQLPIAAEVAAVGEGREHHRDRHADIVPRLAA